MNFFDFENLKNEHLKSLEFHSHKRAKAVIKDSLYNCSVIEQNVVLAIMTEDLNWISALLCISNNENIVIPRSAVHLHNTLDNEHVAPGQHVSPESQF